VGELVATNANPALARGLAVPRGRALIRMDQVHSMPSDNPCSSHAVPVVESGRAETHWRVVLL
jgi:hypothetical protein